MITKLNNIANPLLTTENNEGKFQKRFNFHDYIAPFHPEQMEAYKVPDPKGIIIYRSCISWYPTTKDHTPLQLRYEPRKEIKAALSYEKVERMSEKRRLKELNHLALSCNSSLLAA